MTRDLLSSAGFVFFLCQNYHWVDLLFSPNGESTFLFDSSAGIIPDYELKYWQRNISDGLIEAGYCAITQTTVDIPQQPNT